MMAIHQLATAIVTQLDEAIRLIEQLPVQNKPRNVALDFAVKSRKTMTRLRDDTYEGINDGGHDGGIQDVRELNK